jgi:CHAT domain-containing protein
VISGTATSELGDQNLSEDERKRVARYAAILMKGLDVTQLEKTNIVTVAVTSTNADVAPKAADMMAELFIQKDAEKELEVAQKIYDQITKSIEELKLTISQQEQDFIEQMKTAKLPLGEGKGINLKVRYNIGLSEMIAKTDYGSSNGSTFQVFLSFPFVNVDE